MEGRGYLEAAEVVVVVVVVVVGDGCSLVGTETVGDTVVVVAVATM